MILATLEPEATPFAGSLQALLSEAGSSKDPLQALRMQARRRFEEIGLPSRKTEAFQYFPLKSFYENRIAMTTSSSVVEEDLIERHIVPECRGSCLVFVDGHYRQELSIFDNIDPKVGVLFLEEAMKTFGHFLQVRMTKQIKEEQDPFALLNLAVHPKGAFLYVPPKLTVEHPIQILHVVTQEGALTAPRLQVFVGSQSDVKLYSTTCTCNCQGGVVLDVVDIILEDSARVEQMSTACMRSQGWGMEFLRGSLKNDSTLTLNQVAKNTVGYRRDIKIDLLGSNASAKIQGLALLSDRQQTHTRIVVNHKAPHTESKQHFKGILSGHSQSSFEGQIIVERAAQKTQAYQLCNHLLLGDRAIAHSKPNLEIFADDVKASHGATMTQLKGEELLYLKSRGIDQRQAKNLLIEAFCQEIASTVFLRSLRTELDHFIRSYAQD
ncbi:MAG: SufD family Fe-S cluster assembly protein [Simkania sp.]|nr:SufD family Fe-S cluster assembly protein [Simkania sp.]